jgi:N-acetylmuramoyl-L-alanine amidase
MTKLNQHQKLRFSLKQFQWIVGFWFFWFFWLFCLSASAFAGIPRITHLQVSTFDNNTRLVFSLNGPFHHEIFNFDNPPRVLIDFRQAQLDPAINLSTFAKNDIVSINAKSLPVQELHLDIKLKRSLFAKAFVQKPRGSLGYRLIVDLVPQKISIKKTPPSSLASSIKTKTPILKKKPSSKTKSAPTATEVSPEALAPTKTQASVINRPVIIVIDPGHGGKDPGATGQNGAHEKEVVMDVCQNLYEFLKKQPGVRPELTRKGDYFVPLRGRLKLARHGRADLFLAVHADAYKDRYARGISIFALSQRGATSEAARWLAQKENYSELGGVDLEDKNYLLRSVLIDLSQTATIKSSILLGDALLQSLHQVTQLHCNHVEQAPFVVLKSPDIPSLLIETGFISNRKEEALLQDPQYQQKIATAIGNGIMNYLHAYPPQDSVFSLERFGVDHHVKSGENLATISRQYDVPPTQIKQANHLKKNTLKAGQVLKIPR